MAPKRWTAIAVTAQDQSFAHSFKKELEIRKQKGFIDKDTLLLAVEDPRPNVGSGGASLNALLVVSEYLCANAGYTYHHDNYLMHDYDLHVDHWTRPNPAACGYMHILPNAGSCLSTAQEYMNKRRSNKMRTKLTETTLSVHTDKTKDLNKVVTSDVLRETSILIIHVGVHFPFTSCQHGFLSLPATICGEGPTVSSFSGLACNIDVFLHMLTNQVAADSPPGLWICSADRFLIIPKETKIDWSDGTAVKVFAVPKEILQVAGVHGALKIGKNNIIEDIIFKGSDKEIEPCQLPDGKIPTNCSLVYMNNSVAEMLLSLHVRAPLDACTYIGIDSSAKPVKNMSLFFDVMLALASGITKDDFVCGRRSGDHGTTPQPLNEEDQANRKEARRILWDALNGFEMKGEIITGGDFHYLLNCAKEYRKLLFDCPYKNYVDPKIIKFGKTVHSFCRDREEKDEKESNVITINSIYSPSSIGEETVICHSNLREYVKIGKRCVVSNIKPRDFKHIQGGVCIADDLALTGVKLKLDFSDKGSGPGQLDALILFGTKDDLELCFSNEKSTFCNKPWDLFFNRTGITASELWTPELHAEKRCLMNARLFPVFNPRESIGLLDLLWLQGSHGNSSSLAKWRCSWRLSLLEILDLYDSEWEFQRRRHLYFKIGKLFTEKTLIQKLDNCLLPFFRTCALEGFFEEILKTLDEILYHNTKDPAIISRTLACIADVLGVKAQGRGGLRSGPAANDSWLEGLQLLKEKSVPEAIKFFAAEREKWFSRPDLLVRAARHYERAFQLQVREAVGTARQFIDLKDCEPVPMGKWIVAEAPARMDMAGTWSDTPPICYEHGGSVITIGVKIDGQKPIGSRVKKIPQLHIVLVLMTQKGSDEGAKRIECQEMEDLLNYTQVNSPGALLKAAFFCARILEQSSSQSLKDQLLDKYKCGFELQTWSDLPHGSGLGTSSILAGTVMSALWKAVGKQPDNASAIHAVLDLEQMLTTGGGWQDNVGGINPGVKEGSSARGLPLQVHSTPIQMPDGFLQKLEKHLVLVFTGKTRLARNMLQDVLRNWNARLPEIVETADELVDNAKNCIEAMNKGDLEGIGKCLDRCWAHKKRMAHGCEPSSCRKIMDALRPIVYGQCLAGAGGGGFMYIVSKEENAVEEIRRKLSDVEEVRGKATAHVVTIDMDGMTICIENA